MTALSDAFLTPAEAARELRVSLGTIYNLIHDNSIPVIRVGKQFRISRRALDAAMNFERGRSSSSIVLGPQ